VLNHLADVAVAATVLVVMMLMRAIVMFVLSRVGVFLMRMLVRVRVAVALMPGMFMPTVRPVLMLPVRMFMRMGMAFVRMLVRV
jgi:hypothetical protein